jgi:hypothetical protein
VSTSPTLNQSEILSSPNPKTRRQRQSEGRREGADTRAKAHTGAALAGAGGGGPGNHPDHPCWHCLKEIEKEEGRGGRREEGGGGVEEERGDQAESAQPTERMEEGQMLKIATEILLHQFPQTPLTYLSLPLPNHSQSSHDSPSPALRIPEELSDTQQFDPQPAPASTLDGQADMDALVPPLRQVEEAEIQEWAEVPLLAGDRKEEKEDKEEKEREKGRGRSGEKRREATSWI